MVTGFSLFWPTDPKHRFGQHWNDISKNPVSEWWKDCKTAIPFGPKFNGTNRENGSQIRPTSRIKHHTPQKCKMEPEKEVPGKEDSFLETIILQVPFVNFGGSLSSPKSLPSTHPWPPTCSKVISNTSQNKHTTTWDSATGCSFRKVATPQFSFRMVFFRGNFQWFSDPTFLVYLFYREIRIMRYAAVTVRGSAAYLCLHVCTMNHTACGSA